MKYINWLLLGLLSVSTFQPIYAETQPEKKLNVLTIVPFTGEAAAWGQAFKNGITLGLEELPSEIQSRLNVTYEDDALSARTAITALTRHLGSETPDVVINMSSGTGNALAPITEAKKIVLLAVASDSTISKKQKYAFNFWVTPEVESKVLNAEMKRRGYKRIAIASVIHHGAIAIQKAFDKENNGEIRVILEEDSPPDTRDFKPFIAKLKAKEKEFDAVMLVLFPGQISIFTRQLKEMGIKKDLFGWETLEDLNEVKLAGGTLLGAWYVTGNDGDGAFLKKYGERFPGANSTYAANAHDAIRILGKAMELGIQPDKINEFLATLKDFSGALGTYSASGDQRFLLPAILKEITTDGFKKLDR